MEVILFATFSEQSGPRLLTMTGGQALPAGGLPAVQAGPHVWHSSAAGDRCWLTSTSHGASTSTQQLCIRALSGEHVGPGRQGSVVFGTEKSGYALAYLFQLRDSQARGQHRTFCFIWVRKALGELMLHSSFVSSALAQIAQGLRHSTLEVCVRERRGRLGSTYSAGVSSLKPSSLRRPGALQELRPLSVLLGTPSFTRDLHSRLSWILHSVSRRLQPSPLAAHPSNPAAPDGEAGAAVGEPETGWCPEQMQDLLHHLGPQAFSYLLDAVVRGDQVIATSVTTAAAARALSVVSALLPPALRRVASGEYVEPYRCQLVALPTEVFELSFPPRRLPQLSFRRGSPPHHRVGRGSPPMGPVGGSVSSSPRELPDCSLHLQLASSHGPCAGTVHVDDVRRLGDVCPYAESVAELLRGAPLPARAEAACVHKRMLSQWRRGRLYSAFCRSTRATRESSGFSRQEKRMLQQLGLPWEPRSADAACCRFVGADRSSPADSSL